MKSLKRIISIACSLCILAGVFCSCGKKEKSFKQPVYDKSKYSVQEESGVVAENENYKISWNNERFSVIFTNKKDGTVYGTNPNDYAKLNNTNATADFNNSPLTVQYTINSLPYETMAAASSLSQQAVASEKIENGIKVTYYFPEFKFAVPVKYYLEGDAFKISVDPKEVSEGGDYKVVSVKLNPLVCSTANTKNGSKDSYLVVPSGSGALMYADYRGEDTTRRYTAEVYGEDFSIDRYQDYENDAKISMPFFGARNSKSGIMGIIENGADSCTLTAEAGDSSLGYSYIYPTLHLRSEGVAFLSGTWRNKYEDKTNNVEPIVVSYYGLTSGENNYVSMAKKYQQYLIKNKGLTKTSANKLLNAKLYGYFMEDDLFLGIPTKKAVSMTTYKQAESILKELKNITGGSLSAVMDGYGSGGIDGTQIAGGFKLTGVVGSGKDLKNFISFTDSANINTYFNFNISTFKKSAGGISKGKNAAININGTAAIAREFWKSSKNRLEEDDGGTIKYYLKRKDLSLATEKVIEYAKKEGIKNIAFGDLAHIKYSDYTAGAKYPSAYKMSSDISDILKKAKDSGMSVMAEGPFDYSAINSNTLTGTPLYSTQDRSFDEEVPLYALVFQGYKESYSTPINTSTTRRKVFLKSMAIGSGLSVNLIGEYNTELRKKQSVNFGAYLYDDNKGYIETFINEGGEFLKSVANAEIKNYTILSKDVTKTEFSNGKVIIVNLSDKAVKTEMGTVEAQNFITK